MPGAQELVSSGSSCNFISTTGIRARPSAPNPALSPHVLFLDFWTASGQVIILGNSIPFPNIVLILALIEEKCSPTRRLFAE